MSDLAGYAVTKAFLATKPAKALALQIEQDTGKPAVDETGLQIFIHPQLAQLMARWLENPELIEAVDTAAKPYLQQGPNTP